MKEMRLIDANALLDQNNWSIKQYSEEEADAWRDGIALMKKNIENAPTIDPETLRPLAKWENECDAVGDPIVWTCTNCKDSAVLYEGTPKENGMKFCPYCGAKMEE